MNSFNNKCVLCLLHNNNIKDIFSEDVDNIIIEDKLKYVLPDDIITSYYIKIVNFKPYSNKYICTKCLIDLNEVYKFKQKCSKNLKYLCEFIEEINHKTSFENTQPCSKIKTEAPSEVQIQNVTIKTEPEDLTDNLDEQTNSLDQGSNLEEVVVKGEPEEFNYEIDLKNDPLLTEQTEETSKSSPTNLGASPPNPDISQRPYKCPTCLKCFKRATHLLRHNLTHTGERKYSCDLCQKSFTLSHGLKKHLLVHSGEKPYVCDICQRNFADKSALISHRRIHSNDRPNKCSVCEKSFTRRDNLTIHMRVHTGEKPYNCGMCQYRCTTSGALKLHLRTHTGERPYTCRFCQRPFSTTKGIKKHVQSIHFIDYKVYLEEQNSDA